MPNKTELVVWDSCVIIDAIQQHKERYPAIAPMHEKAKSGKLQIYVSTASIAEVIYLKTLREQGVSQEIQTNLIEQWFDNPFLVWQNIDPGIANLAAKLRLAHGLSTWDASILATAIFNEIPTVYTYDGIGGKNGKLLPLDKQIKEPSMAEPLRILQPTVPPAPPEPDPPAQRSLFDGTESPSHGQEPKG